MKLFTVCAALLGVGGLASPALAQTLGELTCAIGQVPADARADLRSRYSQGGLTAAFNSTFFSRPELVDKVAVNCVDVSKPGFEARSAALGRALASYEVANAAEAVLRSRHKLAQATLNGAWKGLGDADRKTFAAFARSARTVPEAELIEAAAHFLAALRPDSDPDAVAADKALLGDAIAYAAMRAQLEAAVGPI
jgi:hypothetical protein